MIDLKLQLPDNFLEEETRDGYLVSSKMKEVWAVELDLLSEFQRVCEKHNIKWFADGGTLLGAVRHKGMIPWDDDIDLILFREDYDKLISVADEFKEPYFLQTDSNSKQACRSHMQLRNSKTTGILNSEIKDKKSFNQGIFIDIFPLDAASDNDEELKKQVEDAKYYKRKICKITQLTNGYKFRLKKNFVRAFIYFVTHYIYKITNEAKKLEELEKQRDKSIQAYNKLKTKRVVDFSLPPIKERLYWEREWFDETVYLKFEMMTIPAPANYEAILSKFYGNWREFVVGTALHSGIVFDTNRPYTDYIKK